MKLKTILAFAVLLSLATLGMQQMNNMAGIVSSGLGITLEASCTGSGTANYLACSSAMTLAAAGDTIVCNIAASSGGSRLTGVVNDALNGPYNAVYGTELVAGDLSWISTQVLENSAAGTIIPVVYYSSNTNITRSTINCKAWKNTATSHVLDGGAVQQTTRASVINPTSGSSQSPSNNNEVVVAYMDRNSATAPSSGGGSWAPAGTLTVIGGSGMRQSDEYQSQTVASAVQGSFTGNTTAQNTVDTQLAILPNGTTGGYRSLTGLYVPLGAAASAPTGNVTAALIGAAGSYLSTVAQFNASPFWTVSGTPTYDTTINPTATGKIMVQQVAHTFGDAGSSVKYTQAATGTTSVQDAWIDHGEGDWMWSFYRISGTGIVNNDFCDMLDDKGGVTSAELTPQMKYLTSDVGFIIESTDGAIVSGSQRLSLGNVVNTNLRVGEHRANVNERYHQLLIQTKSGSTWSTTSTLNYDNLCTSASLANCTIPAAIATTTGTASSGSTALTVASGTGVLVGQVVLATGIPDPSQSGQAWTTVAAVAGTAVTLSQNTTASLSATTVKFYTKPVNLVTATNCTVTAGSTAMSCVLPGTGTIAQFQPIGGLGIRAGTVAAAVSGAGPISVTLSIPASATKPSGEGATFWTAASSTRIITFGRFASCNTPADQWWSGLLVDHAGTGAFNDPN